MWSCLSFLGNQYRIVSHGVPGLGFDLAGLIQLGPAVRVNAFLILINCVREAIADEFSTVWDYVVGSSRRGGKAARHLGDEVGFRRVLLAAMVCGLNRLLWKGTVGRELEASGEGRKWAVGEGRCIHS
jgi:hypothetical protein